MNDFWADAPIIYSYTRAQAIDDGVLVDVTERAREAGFVWPVALTIAVWEQYVEVPDGVQFQDEAGRLWDVLWMTYVAIKSGKATDDDNRIPVELYVKNTNGEGMGELVTLHAHAGPGDAGEPVITILLPDED